MNAHISLSEWINFNARFLKGEFEGQRFGQAFCNEFNLTDPDIFYNTNLTIVINDCRIKYVDLNDVGANKEVPNRITVPKEKLDKIISAE